MPVRVGPDLDLNAKTATEVWNFEAGRSIFCPYCSSIYEDAPYNYLIDYAVVNLGVPSDARVRSTLRPERGWRDDFLPIGTRPRTVRRSIAPSLFI